mmetsp:Transcript_4593/g.9847  ORF Transcript_4593/g.9847 Transcript_4593/m.9847 type:complete len:452 (+) Transcript_4593:39-1394(+)|eukprot:s2412_g8.t1
MPLPADRATSTATSSTRSKRRQRRSETKPAHDIRCFGCGRVPCCGLLVVAVIAILALSAYVISDRAGDALTILDVYLKSDVLNVDVGSSTLENRGALKEFVQTEASTTRSLRASASSTNPVAATQAPVTSTGSPVVDGPAMQVTDGSGRLGNNLAFILRGLLFAKLTNHAVVNLKLDTKSLREIFDGKAVLPLGSSKVEGSRFCPEKSDKRQLGRPVYNFQGERCKGAKAQDYRTMALEHLQQAFLPEFRHCLERFSPEESAKELTIHLRGQDLWGLAEHELTSDKPIPMEANAHHWLWHQPPCTMYRKIIVEEGFTKVLVVTSPDLRHVCIEWLKSNAVNLGIEVIVQAQSLREDFCALARASNLVLSFSTLGDNAAVLNQRLKKLFFREFAQTHSLLDCDLWPGTTLYQYNMPINEGSHQPYGNTYRDVIQWFTGYDEQQISKHMGCNR